MESEASAAPGPGSSPRRFAFAELEAVFTSSEFGAIYEEQRRLAASLLSRDRAGESFQPTALVHSAWLKLGARALQFRDRRHVIALTIRAMRQVLVDSARRKATLKRQAPGDRVELRSSLAATGADPLDLVALDDALAQLELIDPNRARLFEFHGLVGLSLEEAGAHLGLTADEARRKWRATNAWLLAQLQR